MQNHWDHSCSKARTRNESARLIQNAYRNYKKQPETLAKRVWEAVRNDNTPREKKFLNMPDRETRCTVNLDIWYTNIDGYYRPYHIPLDQFYDYISYSKHKKCQLSDRLAVARNQIQCNYTAPSKYTKPFALMQSSASAPEISAHRFERSQVLIDARKYFDSVRKNARKEIDLISFN